MLALTFTVLAAIYLFAPDLFWRWILGFVVPRRTLVQTRGEEITRAVLVALIPLSVSVLWAIKSGAIRWEVQLPDLECFFSGIYSEQFFKEHNRDFFRAFRTVLEINWALLWRLYLLLFVTTLLFVLIIKKYGWLRNLSFFRSHEWARKLLATIVIPRVSEWHVLLSRFGLPNKHYRMMVDILTSSGVLYRGGLEQTILSPDGGVSGVILSDPLRFRREDYVEAKKEGKTPSAKDYWREIPGKTFIVLGKDMVSINLEPVKSPDQEKKELIDLRNKLSAILNQSITVAKEPGK